LRAFLRKHGASAADIEAAERDGNLALLALDRRLMPGEAQYDFVEVSRRADVPMESAARLWRALGFPDPPTGERRFTDAEVDALSTLRDWYRAELFPADRTLDGLIEQVRVVAAAQTRIAEVQSDQVADALRDARANGLTDEQLAGLIPEAVDWERIAALLDYVMRLQLRAALWRKLAGIGSDGEGVAANGDSPAVGFVDLVGYTALSQELDHEELSRLVGRFDALAYDTVAEHGGRVVKTIGDEVMFVTSEPVTAACIALRLTERSSVDELLPEARAGLACGPLVTHEGDYYGPVVNLASRLVEMAKAGTVLVSDELRTALEGTTGLEFRRLRSRKIRDIGRVELHVLRASAVDAEEPRGERSVDA
jgi:adenylate cyclase